MATNDVYDHPFMPRDLKLPDYVPCFLSFNQILIPFFSVAAVIVAFFWFLSARFKISKVDRVLICWWVFTGLVHTIVEGYFAFTPDFYKENTPHFLAEVWKEYSKGDSRYAGRNAAIVSVEGVTAAIEGPASLLAVYAIAARKPYSHLLQFAVSLGQLYGCIIYYATAFLEGDNFAASPFYYWVYYVFMNFWWILVPSIILVRSWKKIVSAYQVEKKTKTG